MNGFRREDCIKCLAGVLLLCAMVQQASAQLILDPFKQYENQEAALDAARNEILRPKPPTESERQILELHNEQMRAARAAKPAQNEQSPLENSPERLGQEPAGASERNGRNFQSVDGYRARQEAQRAKAERTRKPPEEPCVVKPVMSDADIAKCR